MRYAFMASRDAQVTYFVLKHYCELQEEMESIKNYEYFVSNKLVNKAIKLDLLQIGENIDKYTDEFKNKLEKKDVRGIKDIRNHLVHGYSKVVDIEIWRILNNDLPALIEQIKKINSGLNEVK